MPKQQQMLMSFRPISGAYVYEMSMTTSFPVVHSGFKLDGLVTIVMH